MIQRRVEEQEQNRTHKKNFNISYHKIGNAEDQWRILATFEDEIQLTLRGKTLQVSFSFIFALIAALDLGQHTLDDEKNWKKQAS